MFEYSERVPLGDGSAATVRTVSRADLELLLSFYRSIPDEQRQYLRVDVSNGEAVEKRLKSIEGGRAIRLVAECKGRIVGEVGLEAMRYGWLRKSGEVRILSLPEDTEHAIATLLAREIFLLAARKGYYHLLARVMDTEKELFGIFEELHFKHEATQRSHVVDLGGGMHDLYLLTFDLRKMWYEMEKMIQETGPTPVNLC